MSSARGSYASYITERPNDTKGNERRTTVLGWFFFSFFVMTVVVEKSLKVELDFKGKAQSLLDDKKNQIKLTHRVN